MHDIIKKYAKAGKVAMINPATLFVYRQMPHRLREAAVYSLLAARRGKLPDNRFLIFAQGRTGSTVLVDLMNSHPDVFTYGEIMQRNVVTNLWSPRWWAEGLSTLSKKPTVGFKVKITQLIAAQQKDPGSVLADFDRHGWKIVHLRRANILRHAVSDIRAEKTGHFHTVGSNTKVGAKETGGKKKSKQVHIDWHELEREMKHCSRNGKAEAQALASVPHITIEYEKDLGTPERQERSLRQVFEYINVPPVAPKTEFKKVTPRALGDIIVNFDELVPKLKDSEFAEFLD